MQPPDTRHQGLSVAPPQLALRLGAVGQKAPVIRILILSMLMAGCGALPQTNDKIVPISWHKTKSRSEAALFCRSLKANWGPRYGNYLLAGCYYLDFSGVCHVVTADFADRLDDLGHEVKHCFDGEWHDAFEKPLPGAFIGDQTL